MLLPGIPSIDAHRAHVEGRRAAAACLHAKVREHRLCAVRACPPLLMTGEKKAQESHCGFWELPPASDAQAQVTAKKQMDFVDSTSITGL